MKIESAEGYVKRVTFCCAKMAGRILTPTITDVQQPTFELTSFRTYVAFCQYCGAKITKESSGELK